MDYPRDYIVPNLEINYGTAFLVMPIRENFNLVHQIIVSVCKGLKIKAVRADDISRQDIIMANILEGIAKSEIVIVDITNNNPNVFYELGIAHSLRARHSIIIITQDGDFSHSPFDIRHWSILKYDLDNIDKFKVDLRKKIKSCRETINSEDYIINILKSYAFSHVKIQDFISTAQRIGSYNIDTACSILADNTNKSHVGRDEIRELDRFLTTLGDYNNGVYEEIAWHLKYLIFSSDFIMSQYIDTITKIYLKDWKRDSIDLKDRYYWSFVANLCCKMIEKNHPDKQEAINWLVSYLGNPRMGRIDSVRTNIETFLLTTNDIELDASIVQLLTSNSRSAKESAIDICGQKPIHKAANNLLKIIRDNDSDPFIIRSTINALARLNITEAGNDILKWMQSNRDKWGDHAVSSSLKNVAEIALSKLDTEAYRQLINI